MKTASGARAVQIVHSQYRGSRTIEHIGSAHTDADLELPGVTRAADLLKSKNKKVVGAGIDRMSIPALHFCARGNSRKIAKSTGNEIFRENCRVRLCLRWARTMGGW